MQNKPNFLDALMNVTSFYTVDYENKSNWKLGENKANTKPIQSQSKPIQSQYKPNSRKAKMNVTSILTKDYESERLCRCGQNKPNQTQFQKGYLTAPHSVAQSYGLLTEDKCARSGQAGSVFGFAYAAASRPQNVMVSF